LIRVLAGTINLEHLSQKVDWDELFSLPKDYWVDDAKELHSFFEEQVRFRRVFQLGNMMHKTSRAQVGSDLPPVIAEELKKQEERIHKHL